MTLVPDGPTADAATRAQATFEPVVKSNVLKVFLVHTTIWFTNHVVAHIPSVSFRHMWYRRVLGMKVGKRAVVHLGCYVWFYSPGQLRRDGLVIPFAAFDGKHWSAPWPMPDVDRARSAPGLAARPPRHVSASSRSASQSLPGAKRRGEGLG